MSKRDDANTLLKIALDFAVGMSYVLLEYYTTRPSEAQLLRMRIGLIARRFCQHRADIWQDRALKAATYYQRQRSIT